MKIGFFGGGEQAAAILDRIISDRDHVILFVHPRGETGDPIVAAAERGGVPVMPVRDVNSPEAIAFVKASGAEILVSVNAKQIFKSELLSLVNRDAGHADNRGAINLHNGLLPRQRGGGGACVGIINNEWIGCTIHYVDEGIDTGEIIRSLAFECTEATTMGSFMADVLEASPGFMAEVLHDIERGTARSRPQAGNPYYYVPGKPDWAEFIDWDRPADEIFAMLRARTPGPGGTYLYKDKLFRVLDYERDRHVGYHKNAPGQVIGKRKGFGVLVKTEDYALWIKKVEPVEGGEAFVPNYKLGDMLRPHVYKELHALKQRLARLEDLLSKRP